MKYLFVILICVLFASCNQEELQKQNEVVFIDLVKKQIEINDERINKIFIRIDRKQQVRDKHIYQEILRLQKLRDKALEQPLLSSFKSIDTVAMKQYEMVLKTPIEIGYNQDTINHFANLLAQDIDKIRYRHIQQSKSQKMAWISQLLMIESWFLEYYKSQTSLHCGFGRHTYTFSDSTNIYLNQENELVIFPVPEYGEGVDFEGNHYVLGYEFNFFQDGTKIKTAYELERIDGIGILRFTLPKKGLYEFRGEFYVIYDNGEKKPTFIRFFYEFECN